VEVHQAELVRMRDELRRVPLLGVVFGLAGPDLPFGEHAREPAQLLLLLAQGKRNACRSDLFDGDHQVSAVLD